MFVSRSLRAVCASFFLFTFSLWLLLWCFALLHCAAYGRCSACPLTSRRAAYGTEATKQKKRMLKKRQRLRQRRRQRRCVESERHHSICFFLCSFDFFWYIFLLVLINKLLLGDPFSVFLYILRLLQFLFLFWLEFDMFSFSKHTNRKKFEFCTCLYLLLLDRLLSLRPWGFKNGSSLSLRFISPRPVARLCAV